MQEEQKVVGVDGCRGGWIACALFGKNIEIEFFSSWRQLLKKHEDSTRILVDIPMGLSDSHFNRTVDRNLRKALNSRKSSVFTPPCRAAIYTYTYEEALKKNRAITGKGISKQAYFLAPKIRELDDYLGRKIQQRPLCYESHPELNFQLLNGDESLGHSKKSDAGIQKRWALIEKYLPELATKLKQIWATSSNNYAQKDDLLDAACLALVANQKRLKFIEDTGKKDHRGILIKIACYDA